MKLVKRSLVKRSLVLVVLVVFVGGAAGCITSVNQMQTARPLPPKEVRIEAGSSVPIATRYVSEIVDTLDLIADRLSDAENAGEPLTEAEQRQAVEGVAAVLLLQPSFVPELALRVGVYENIDVGLRWAGPTFRFDGKWQVAQETDRWHLAVNAAYVHHTGIGSSIATSAFDFFESIKLVSFSRRDLELSLLASTDEKRTISYYGGLRYILSMPRIESEVIDTIEVASGEPLLATDTNMHHIGATAGIRLGWRGLSLLAELTLMYMSFSPEILGEKSDLGGLLISPGIGVALEI
ncbi:hypothetical protein [Haliangium sp.]|uniref:hypothetical protein n=1 Tax=Haliangium sp. TaxID=2663208 RepID=UPI003D12CE35